MLNLLEIGFLICGWICGIKGLLIISLAISAVFMIISLTHLEKGKISVGLFIQLTCLILSITKLSIGF